MNIKLSSRIFFKGWGANLFGKSRKRRKDLGEELEHLENLEETDVLSPKLYERKVEISAELYNLLVEEEVAWMQKSHEKWLLKGDRNTDYFHRLVNGRRRRNTIFSLSCGDEMIEGTKNLLKHATEFYKELFGPAAGNLCRLKENMWEPNEKLSNIDNFI